MGAGWASAGKSGVDANHGCHEEVLPGDDQHAGCGVHMVLGRFCLPASLQFSSRQ